MSSRDSYLSQWEDSKADFLAGVASTKATLKILLKTKDDHYFLESWIQHHAKIVGLNNLIIFDNRSSNEQVLKTYEKYQSQVPIVQFDGDHNSLHNGTQYPELYECLKTCSQFFVFLDTDEFLVLATHDAYICDKRILEFLNAHGTADVFPASWLENVLACDKRFRVGKSLENFADGLTWGKPIIRAAADERDRCIIHNIQLEKSLFYDEILTNFFVLHMKHLFPQQRIDSNMNKLIAKGFASPGASVESVLAKDLKGLSDKAARMWITELKELVKRSDPIQPARVSLDLQEGCLELTGDGRILYYSEAEAAALKRFLSDSQEFVRGVLQADFRAVAASFRQAQQRKWKEAAKRSEYDRMASAVRRIADLHLPQGANVVVVSKGDPRLLQIPGRQTSHFPQGERGEYSGFYPNDDVEAIELARALRAKGTEFLIFPQTAFWWLSYYKQFGEYLETQHERIYGDDNCVIYSLLPSTQS